MPVDHINDLDWTALHKAIIYGDGTSPRDLAAERGQDRVVAAIEGAA